MDQAVQRFMEKVEDNNKQLMQVLSRSLLGLELRFVAYHSIALNLGHGVPATHLNTGNDKAHSAESHHSAR